MVKLLIPLKNKIIKNISKSLAIRKNTRKERRRKRRGKRLIKNKEARTKLSFGDKRKELKSHAIICKMEALMSCMHAHASL